MKALQDRRQGGFTLVELSIVIAILSLLGVGMYVFTDTGGRGKAVTLLNLAQQTGGALDRLKADSGCHTQRLAGLWTNSVNVAANTFCGVAIADAAWRGPYLKPSTTDPNSGAELLDNVVSGAQMAIQREAGGIGQRYFLRVSGLPADLVTQALLECNGGAGAAAGFDTNKCRAAPGGGGDANGAFDYLYDETR